MIPPLLGVMAAGSSTRSGSTSSTDAAKKKFACSHPACGKAFSRSEHLHRHSLNHKEGNNTCARCSAHFRRRDLLDRHMARHKEKDDEAGGEGLGHLATRKRLWRDDSGQIIQGRRPCFQDGLKRRQSSCASSASTQPGCADEKRRRTLEMMPPSPPSSRSSSSGHSASAELLLHDPWPVEPLRTPGTDSDEHFDFLCNADWSTQDFQPAVMSSGSELSYDHVFKPEAASFDAPFTSMSHYNWMFESDHGSSQPRTQEDAERAQERMPVISAASSYASSPEHISGCLSPTSLDPHLLSTHDFQDSPFSTPGASQSRSSFSSQQSLLSSPLSDELSPSAYHSPEPASFLDYESPSMPSMYPSTPLPTRYTASSGAATPPSQRSSSLSTPLFQTPTYRPRAMAKLPLITHPARTSLLRLIQQAQRSMPPSSSQTTQLSVSDRLLSLMSLQLYLDLFFTRFNATYPLIQQSSFRAEDTHPALLMAVLLLGASYADDGAMGLVGCLHAVLSEVVETARELAVPQKMWLLQTRLLMECFERKGAKGAEKAVHGIEGVRTAEGKVKFEAAVQAL